MDLFFGFNHPIYQEIEYRDLRKKTVMHAEVLEECNKNLTYSISEKEGKHLGGDFILEGKVRRQKMLASKGSDTEVMWRNVSRSLDGMINITKSVNNKLHIHELDGERVTSISFEVLRWRALLRHTNYLVKFAGRNLAYNMYGEPLHRGVINISENAGEKRIQYFNLWRENGVVSRGEIEFLRVSDCEIDDLLFQYEDENDNF